MTKFKKIFISLILFLFFSNCGYTPIFSKRDVNFSIENIKLLGDKDIGEKISNELSNYKNKPNKEKKISLVVTNSKNIIIVSKNSKGQATTNRISADVNVRIILAKNNIFEKNFNKSSTYNVIDRKSEQNLIENKLIDSLSGEIARQIILEILEKTK